MPSLGPACRQRSWPACRAWSIEPWCVDGSIAGSWVVSCRLCSAICSLSPLSNFVLGVSETRFRTPDARTEDPVDIRPDRQSGAVVLSPLRQETKRFGHLEAVTQLIVWQFLRDPFDGRAALGCQGVVPVERYQRRDRAQQEGRIADGARDRDGGLEVGDRLLRPTKADQRLRAGGQTDDIVLDASARPALLDRVIRPAE